MIEIKKSIEQGFGSGGLYDILKQLQNAAFLTQTKVYYVFKGGNNTTGESWETAFNTIKAAITAQTALVAGLPSAQQNVNSYIIIAPGTYDENITELPFSCTIIGLGIPGTDKSVRWVCDTGACIAGTVSGLRLVNISFGSASGDLLAFNISNNVEILDCIFYPTNTAVVNAISNSGGASHLTIRNCKFTSGLAAAGFTRCLYFTSWFHSCTVENNILEGMDANGTAIYIDVLSVASDAIIRNNIIKLGVDGLGTGIAIDDNTNEAMVVGNTIFHNSGTPLDINTKLAYMNVLNKNGVVTWIPTVAGLSA